MCVQRRFGFGLLLGVMIVVVTVRARADDMRLRLTWGEGPARAWRGTIRVSEGEITAAQRLALEADAAGSTTIVDGEVRFWQRSPAAFDGLDVHLDVPDDARLTIEMQAPASGLPAESLEIPVSSFRASRTHFETTPLDEQGNRLVIRRAPGDRLRVEFDAESLVFSPGERFGFSINPTDLALPAGTTVRCDMQLVGSTEGTERWRQHVDLEVDSNGATLPIGPITMTLPAEEGVYDLTISLSEWKFLRYYVVLQRKVQLVVVDGAPRPAAIVSASAALTGTWRDVDSIELMNPNWWARWNPLPALPKVPGVKPGPLGREHLRERDQAGVRWTELSDWVAAPLPTARVGQPHLLEIEFPSDHPQTLGISIVEPSASGDVRTLSLDSGFDVPSGPPAASGTLEKHRLVFWPRTRSPWLVLTNRRGEQVALFGKIRVRAGPTELPPPSTLAGPGALGPAELGAEHEVTSAGRRLLAVYYERPAFPDHFSAPEALDPPTGRSLHDWNRFYVGARRLIEYLKYAGYNGAVISVARDGGAIYPSRVLESNLRYENGPLFFTGQDPQRKDVLEMLFRMFDREGLTLVPAVQFATPLPALERVLDDPEADTEGIELIEVDGAGRPRRGRLRARRGLGPYYNPLEPRVQTAMHEVATELAQRYGEHPSFGGLAVQMHVDGYTQLPGVAWGLDDQTFARFAADTQVDLPDRGPGRYAERAEFVAAAGRDRWLNWRAEQLATFYRRLQQQLAASRPDARLYLATADLVSSWSVRNEMRPRLLHEGDFGDAMRRHGLDASRFADQREIVLLRSQRLAPLNPLAAQALNLAVRQDATVDEFFADAARPGSLYYHETQTRRLPEFDAVSPFGPERTLLRMDTHIAPAGLHNRQRFAHGLARLDAQAVIEGGWLAPLGQEEAVRDLFSVYRALPAVSFEQVASDGSESSPVVVRSARHGGKTYVYAVNDSPWAATLALRFQQACQIRRLGRPNSAAAADNVVSVPKNEPWNVSLAPYDLIAGVIDDPAVEIDQWRAQLEGDQENELRESIRDIAARINQLRNPEPLDVLRNPDFDIGEPNQLPGWQHAQREGVVVKPVEDHRIPGGRSLYMQVTARDGVAWIRSEQFPLPTTGRITIQALARTRTTDRQPPLRFSVDLLVDGRMERVEFDPYRYAPLGTDVDRQGRPTGKPVPNLPDGWTQAPFVAQIDDLPVGGPTEMTIGFDLMGPGEVWIDEVRVYDKYFQVNEQRELLKHVATANSQLDRGKLVECARFLDSYWPRFLVEQTAPPARLARVPAAAPPLREPATTPPAEKPSAWERFTPKLRFPSFPFGGGE